MKLTAKLAYSQIKTNRNRAFWTLAGIVLSTAMLTAVFGFASSADLMFKELLGESDYYNSMYNELLLGLSAVVGSVIIAATVIVVSNAFRVSAGERIKQFGALKSVGATKQQIAGIITHEGLILATVGIPLGIALGLLVNFVGIQIMDHLLAAANKRNTFQVNFDFVVAWQAILVSAVLSFVTVWMSAWLPARKAAKMAAIDAIRGTDEVKIKARDVRGGRLIGKLFGYEGTLAYKSLKRSRRNFRATVVSLTMSIILFIVAGYFGEHYKETTRLFYPVVDNANVVGEFLRPEKGTLGHDGDEQTYHTLNSVLADEVTQKFREYPNTTVFGVGDNLRDEDHSYKTVIPKEMLTSKMKEFLDSNGGVPVGDGYSFPITLYAIDAENYAELCERAGVSPGSNILVNYVRIPGDNGDGKAVFTPFVSYPKTLLLTNQNDHSVVELPLEGALDLRDVPNEIAATYVGNMMVIVPRLDATRYTWFVDAADPEGFKGYATKILHESIAFEGSSEYIDVKSGEEVPFAMRDITRLILVFIYGFITMLTLIGLTNVISTISTNVLFRDREFAALRSVGMTPAGLKRMLTLESILCSVKSLVIGVPLGMLGSYLLYRAFSSPVELDFAIPWLPIVQCTLGVIAVTWIIMRFSLSRLRDDNIVETIRLQYR